MFYLKPLFNAWRKTLFRPNANIEIRNKSEYPPAMQNIGYTILTAALAQLLRHYS